MKSSFTDFLVCGGVLSLIVALAWLIVGVGISPYSQAFFGDYYVIVNVLLFMLAYGIVSGLMLRLMLKIKPLPCGEFSMDSPVFTYWKLLSVVFLLAQEVMIPFTSIFTKPLVWRLFGARVGSDVALGGAVGEPFMVTIEDGAVLGLGSVVAGSVIADGKITLGNVRVGKGATLGVYALAMGGIDIGDNAKVVGGSMLLPGSRIPDGEVWRGNPARKWSVVGAAPKSCDSAG